MALESSARAQALIEALSHAGAWRGRTVVVKYGGNAMTNADLKRGVMDDVALLSQAGVRLVLVHGGGPEITGLLTKLGKKSEFVDGLRVTDQETVEVVQMVLAGKVNKDLVNLLGARAVGICGVDARLLVAEKADARLGFVGAITAVNSGLVEALLQMGYIPVISTVGCGGPGEVYNINADTAAARIAGALRAEALVTMTDIAGLLRDPADPASRIARVTKKEIGDLMACGVITGGMIPKIACCLEAMTQGVRRVNIIDGRVPHALLLQLMTDDFAGTTIVEE